jgi:hypothetical protein
MRVRSVIAFVSVTPLLIAASNPVRLEPSSPWVVDYAENSCRLVRQFGERATTTKLAFESPAPGEWDMLVIGKPLETYEKKVTARFLPLGGKSFDGKVAKAVTTGEPAILWSHPWLLPQSLIEKREEKQKLRSKNPNVRPPAIDAAERDDFKKEGQAFAAATTEVEIDTGRNHAVILETGSLGKAMAEFEECGRESLKDWGVDPDLEDKIVLDVWATNTSQWLSAADYPGALLSSGQEADVDVRLLIDAAGRITKCTSLSHFKDEEFNRITCARITERARFEPAELADGTKVPSYYTKRVRFQIAH